MVWNITIYGSESELEGWRRQISRRDWNALFIPLAGLDEVQNGDEDATCRDHLPVGTKFFQVKTTLTVLELQGLGMNASYTERC